MSIVSSSYELDGPVQANGRQWIKELHTDSVGMVHERRYLALPGTNYQEMVNLRVVDLADRLADDEFDEVIRG